MIPFSHIIRRATLQASQAIAKAAADKMDLVQLSNPVTFAHVGKAILPSTTEKSVSFCA